MEHTFLSDVDEMISGLETKFAGDHDLSHSADGWTDTCFTCGCVTK